MCMDTNKNVHTHTIWTANDQWQNHTWEFSHDICLLSVVASSNVWINTIGSGQNFRDCLNTCVLYSLCEQGM